MAFETATFPHWVRWFQAGNQDILLARDDAGAICATLLLDGPGADTVFEPMLGRAAATIDCVGVAPHGARTRHRHRPGGTRVGDTSRPRVPAPATSAGPSASRSTPARDTGPGAATACSARAPATSFAVPPDAFRSEQVARQSFS